MSDEQFLARWSRRKQEAKAGHAEPAPEKAAEAQESSLPDRTAVEPVLPEMDLTSLPPIESIDAATDITAFLRKGIPLELSRAALRRAWSADPAIRDFVGLAENAWDFNDPNAMSGFGPLDYSAEQVDALVRRITGGMVRATESFPIPPADTAEDPVQSASLGADFPQAEQAITDPRALDESRAAELPANSAVLEPTAATDASEETFLSRRTHGGALPR
jgi:hypothetical protein